MRWPWSSTQPGQERLPVNAGEAFGYDAETINRTANILWDRIRAIVDHYRAAACPCAFPRFLDVVAFDGIQRGGSCYCSETEASIQFAREHFTRVKIDADGEVVREIWTCATCKSTFIYGWSDFSIHVSRSYLKPDRLIAKPLGASSGNMLCVHLGVFGHAYPPDLRGSIRVTNLEKFDAYMRELA